MRVGKNLDLDVTRINNELLDEDTVVAKGTFRLGTSTVEAVANFRLRPGDAHALAAAPGRRLDHDRIADLAGDLFRVVGVLDDAQPTRDGAHLGSVGEFLGFDLVAHGLDRLGLRTDEGDPLRLKRFAE